MMGVLCIYVIMKANVKVCVSLHIACVDDILFLIMITSTLWDSYLKKIQSSLEISSCIVKCSC